MAYLTINGVDYSPYVNKLNISTKHKYTSRESASGDLLVKYIKAKKVVQVGIIPLDTSTARSLMSAINGFNVTVQYLEPATNSLRTISCIIPINSVEYYTINANGTKTKAFTFTCEEL